MKTRILFAVLILMVQTSSAQTVAFSGRTHDKIYSIIVNHIIRNSPTERFFPKTIIINGGIMPGIHELLAENSYNPSVKRFILDSGWSYVKKIDLLNCCRKSEIIRTKRLSPVLDINQKIMKVNFEYHLSPILYSQDSTQAMVVFQRVGSSEIGDEAFYYLTKQDNTWRIVKVQRPFLF